MSLIGEEMSFCSGFYNTKFDNLKFHFFFLYLGDKQKLFGRF